MQQSSWDDGDTIAVSESLHQPHKHKENKRPLPKPPRVESIPCGVPGCDKLFISEAERDNHVEFHHSPEQDTTSLDFGDSSSLYYQARDLPEDEEGDTTILARAYVEQEQTIKPQLTAESLQALAATIESDSIVSITKSLHHTSIHDAMTVERSIHDPRESAQSLMSLDETTFSIDDPLDEEQLSDAVQQDAPEIRLSAKILLHLWAKLVNDRSRQLQQGFRQHGGPAELQGRRSSHSMSKEDLSSAGFTSGTSGVRRKRLSDDENGITNRKNQKRSNSSQFQERPLACPFNKFDSYRFGNDPNNPQYNVCNTWCDVKTAYLKQHLTRSHSVPEFQCDRCMEDLVNHANLRAHRRADPPCALGIPDDTKIMPEHQAELGLRTRNSVGLDRTTYWFRVYDTIFGPEARRLRPVDPHYTGPYKEIVQQFVQFGQVRMSDIIQRARQALDLDPNSSPERDAQLGQMVLQEAMQAFMTELTQNRQPSIQEIRNQNTALLATPSAGQHNDTARDINRPLQQILPANWQAPLPTHSLQPAAMQTSQILSPRLQQSARSIISAPTTPAATSAAVFSGSTSLQHESHYDGNMWQATELQYDFLGTSEQFLPDEQTYTAGNMSQGELEDYVVDGFFNNPGPSDPSRRERRTQ